VPVPRADGRHFIAPAVARPGAAAPPPAYWVGTLDAGVHFIVCGGEWDDAPEFAPLRAGILAEAADLMAAAGIPQRAWVPFLRARGWSGRR
jgi:hypothetical protein